jgi:hypothetical protein
MRHLSRFAAIAAALVCVGVLGTAAPALAADPVSDLKAAITTRIDLRLAALNKDLADINAAKNITGGHRSTLSTVLSNDTAGLTSLKGKVAAETTLIALHDDATSMVNDYRVYTLVGPKVRLTIAGDSASAAIGKAQQAHDKLAAAVAEKKAGGTDTTVAEADLADMQSSISAATAHLSGQVDTLLAVQPGPDLASINNSVDTTRAAIVSTRTDLRNAMTKGKAVLAFLKSA